MPRNMSFAMTTAQVRDRSKVVTRRNGWWFLEPADIVNAVEKARGIRKGEKIERICLIRIASTRKERLYEISAAECVLEGFPGMMPEEFIEMYCKANRGATPESDINRISFEYVGHEWRKGIPKK